MARAEVLRLEDVEKPTPDDHQVLIKVHAASGESARLALSSGGTPYVMRLQTGLRKPKSIRLGVDFAGTVEAVGGNVTQFKPGDEVFGGRTGAFAEYVCARRGSSRRAEAGQPDVRAGGLRPDRGDHGTAGPSRQGQDSAGAEGPDQRRVGRRGHVRRADRQVVRRGRDRRVAARGTWTWSAHSARITSSTTRRRISRRAGNDTT